MVSQSERSGRSGRRMVNISPCSRWRVLAALLAAVLVFPLMAEAAVRRKAAPRRAAAGKRAVSRKPAARRAPTRQAKGRRPVRRQRDAEIRRVPATPPMVEIPVEPVSATQAFFEPAAFVEKPAAPPRFRLVPGADWDYGVSMPRMRRGAMVDAEAENPVRLALERPALSVPVLLAQAVSAPAPAATAAKPVDPPKPAPPPARRQPAVLTVGLIGGGHLRDLFQKQLGAAASLEDTSGRVLVGPTLQFHWTRFAVSVDALYRGYGLRSSGNLLGLGFDNRSTGRTWEFPLLLKRKFYPESASFRPVIGAGIAMRYLGQTSTLSTADRSVSEITTNRQFTFGLPLAAGMEFRLERFRFMPEVRYTLWTADNATPIRTQLFDPNYNQFQLLFAFTF